MRLALVSETGNILGRTAMRWQRRRDYSSEPTIFDFGSHKGGCEIVLMDCENLIFDDDIVIDPVIDHLVAVNPLKTIFDANDRKSLKFYRICAQSCGLALKKGSNDHPHDEVWSRFQDFSQRALNHSLGVCIARGLGMDLGKTKTLIKNAFLKNTPHLAISDSDLDQLCCSAPNLSIIVKYKDAILEEETEDTLDVALFSSMAFDEDTDSEDPERESTDNKDSTLTIRFTPVRYEFEKQAMETYLQQSLDLLFRKYASFQGITFTDSVFRTAIVQEFFTQFNAWVSRNPDRCRVPHLFAFAPTSTPLAI
jgi:hypothetical protein